MVVQQNKKSPSKRGMHRSHDALTAPALFVDSTTGEVHRPHHISPNGMYRASQSGQSQRRIIPIRLTEKARTLPCNYWLFLHWTHHPSKLSPYVNTQGQSVPYNTP